MIKKVIKSFIQPAPGLQEIFVSRLCSQEENSVFLPQCCNESPTGRVTSRVESLKGRVTSRVISVFDRVKSSQWLHSSRVSSFTRIKSSDWFKPIMKYIGMPVRNIFYANPIYFLIKFRSSHCLQGSLFFPSNTITIILMNLLCTSCS